jgi:hypothetical protein
MADRRQPYIGIFQWPKADAYIPLSLSICRDLGLNIKLYTGGIGASSLLVQDPENVSKFNQVGRVLTDRAQRLTTAGTLSLWRPFQECICVKANGGVVRPPMYFFFFSVAPAAVVTSVACAGNNVYWAVPGPQPG